MSTSKVASTSRPASLAAKALGCVDCGVEQLDENGRWIGAQKREIETPISGSERAQRTPKRSATCSTDRWSRE